MTTLKEKTLAQLLHFYPLISGCGTVAHHKLLKNIVPERDELVYSTIPGGSEILVPLNDYIGRAVYLVGDLDRKITKLLFKIIKPGDTVLDIGANLGLVTFMMSKLVGNQGRVYSFEPNPKMMSLMEKSKEKNKSSNITFFPVALGKEKSELKLLIPENVAGKASLVKDNFFNTKCQEILVPVEKLSTIMSNQEINEIKLIKIDVEGFEPDVLSGAIEFLTNHPPKYIIFELNDKCYHLKNHPTIEILNTLDYQFFSLPKTYLKYYIQPLDINSEEKIAAHDFLAVKKGVNYQEIQGIIKT